MAEDRTVTVTCNRMPAVTALSVKDRLCSHPSDYFLWEETVATGNAVLIPLLCFREKLDGLQVRHLQLALCLYFMGHEEVDFRLDTSNC